MDNFLISSLIIIFFTALIGSYMQRRRRESVLKELEGYHITVKFKDGKKVWGKFRLYPRGMELLFSRPYLNSHNHKITSFIVYPGEMEHLQALFRYHDELTPENKERRLEEVHAAKHPGILTRIGRTLTNFLSAFHDAIDESLGILINRVKATTANPVLKTSDKKLRQLGSSALNIVDYSAWDPILEQYLFKNVVMEIVDTDGKVVEYSGVLKDYSSDWMAVLDCEIDTTETLPLSDANRLMLQRKLDFWIRLSKENEKIHMHIRIENESDREVELRKIRGEHYTKKIETTLQPGASIELDLNDLPEDTLKEVEVERFPIELSLIGPERVDPKSREEVHAALPTLFLEYRTVQSLDLFVPRRVGVIRHAALTEES